MPIDAAINMPPGSAHAKATKIARDAADYSMRGSRRGQLRTVSRGGEGHS